MVDASNTSKRCPVWVKVVLAASLAVNLAIVGLVAGFVLRGGVPMAGPLPGMGYATPYMIALPKDARRQVFRAVRDDESLPNRRERRDDYEDMTRAIRATPFDAAAVNAVLDRQVDAQARVQAAARSAWVQTVSGMSGAARAAYADEIAEMLRRGGKKNGKGPRKDAP